MAHGSCYRCDKPATSREHFPPKSFFPRGGNLQLQTVGSCDLHNTKKSGDDQYLLAHICMHAAREENLAQKVFLRSIAPQIRESAGFKHLFSDRIPADGGRFYYPVDVSRFDKFFDALSCAIFFSRFKERFDASTHRLSHIYPTLVSNDLQENAYSQGAREQFKSFFDSYVDIVENFQADKIDEVVYGHVLVAPAGSNASITIAHTFYGVFEVITLITYEPWRLAREMGLI